MHVKEISDIISDPIVLSVVAYISLILTIYQGLTHKRKQIYYRVSNRKDGCDLLFWNGGDTTIFKNDIMYLCCEIYSRRITYLYSSDEDIQLEIKQDSENNNKYNLSFDFLNRGEGFFIALDNNGGESRVDLMGRIRGEERKSVYRLNGPIDFRLNSSFKILTEATLVIGLLINLRTGNYRDFEMYFTFFVCLVIMSIDLLVSLVKARVTSIPSSLKYKQNDYNNDRDYYDLFK